MIEFGSGSVAQIHNKDSVELEENQMNDNMLSILLYLISWSSIVI
jgi:hypothetical protein